MPDRPTDYQQEKAAEGDTEHSRTKRTQESQGTDDPAGTPDSAKQQEQVNREVGRDATDEG